MEVKVKEFEWEGKKHKAIIYKDKRYVEPEFTIEQLKKLMDGFKEFGERLKVRK